MLTVLGFRAQIEERDEKKPREQFLTVTSWGLTSPVQVELNPAGTDRERCEADSTGPTSPGTGHPWCLIKAQGTKRISPFKGCSRTEEPGSKPLSSPGARSAESEDPL